MEFLQPSWLWGMLAVAVPVAIHFWNQKKGKTIEWAASRWLFEKTTLNHRGIRLYEIPLMLIRCLLLILLAWILSKPILDWLDNQSSEETIHLVQPDRILTNNFRFELENALKKGEKVYWIEPDAKNVENLAQMPGISKGTMHLQQTINKTATVGSKLKIYLLANQELAILPKVYVPGAFQLYALPDTSSQPPAALKFSNGNAIHALISYKNSAEQATVQAALKALADVYDAPFSIDLKSDPGKKYDLIATDSLPHLTNSQTLYVLSGKVPRLDLAGNVIQIPDSLRLSSSEIIENGRLPELLGKALLQHNRLTKSQSPLSSQQLNAMFVQTKPIHDRKADRMRKWLLLAFILIFLLERGMSLRKNKIVSYA
ncbi:BatA domain-containing protein [Dyadobacter sp. CY323]|uniref:BatA domain-containing protein n=1 Tax=Dyadobacter sp. CY323 TaxID=2907302 RepID=UPI001F3E41DD|nr:BatA domain-containing protein [Dyadobacter sp. CY323]MCE6987525.1 BatA domain-containing protein [Dyadobacter sp. CY323]